MNVDGSYERISSADPGGGRFILHKATPAFAKRCGMLVLFFKSRADSNYPYLTYLIFAHGSENSVLPSLWLLSGASQIKESKGFVTFIVTLLVY